MKTAPFGLTGVVRFHCGSSTGPLVPHGFRFEVNLQVNLVKHE